jgi:hypothetical protein
MRRRITAAFAALTILLGCVAVALPVQAATGGAPVPVYRVYNRRSGLHHYTTNVSEKNALVNLGWSNEGTSFYAVKQGSASGLKLVYREYNPHDGNHNWTLNKTEHDKLVKLGWKSEGVAWYTNPAGVNPVYRLYNPHSGEHVYTTSASEYAQVGKAGWHKEGVAWKGLATPAGIASNVPSFANGYTKTWSTNLSVLKSGTGDSVVFPTLVAQTDNVWVYSVSFLNSAAHAVIGINPHSGSRLWVSRSYGVFDCLSTLLQGQLVCGINDGGAYDTHANKLAFVDPSNGKIASTVPFAAISSAPTDTLSLRAVYKNSVILQDETIQSNDKYEWLMGLLALDSSGRTIWRSKQFYSGVENNNLFAVFASHIRIADGIGVFVNYSPGRAGSFAINLDNGGLLSASGSELFGTTLVAGGSGGSASSSSFTMPSGKAGTIVQGDPVTFATGTPVPSHPILQRNDSSSAVGYEAPPTAISSPDYGWTIDSSTPGMALKPPSAYGTFIGAYNNGELIFLDDTGHVIRVDEHSGKILWSSTYTGFAHGHYDNYCVRAAVLNDGTVLIQDYTHPAIFAPDGMPGTGFVVALSGKTGARLWQADGNTPLDAYEGMREASDTSSIAQQLNAVIPVITGSSSIQGSSQTLARLDPVKP